MSAVFGALNELIKAQSQSELAQKQAQLAMREGVMTAQLEAAQMVGKIRAQRQKKAEQQQAQEQAAAPEPFELDLSGGPLAEQPVNFSQPMAQMNPAAFTNAAAAAARPGDGIQQQLKAPGGPGALPAAAEGLPVAGDRIRGFQARTGTQYLQEPGGYVAVPQVNVEATEQPNQLTAGDILRAKIEEAAGRRAQESEAAQLALRREEFGSNRQYQDAMLELEKRKTVSQERRDDLWLKLQMKMAQTRLGRLGVSLTPGEEERDKEFGKQYATRATEGWRERSESNIAQLSEAVGELRAIKTTRENLTGPGVGATPERVRSFLNPKSLALQRKVEQVLQQSADDVLDSQYAARELQDLLKRAFDPSLEEGENATALARLVGTMRKSVDETSAKDDYFNRLGSLWGYDQFQAVQRAQGGDAASVDEEGARVEALEGRLAPPEAQARGMMERELEAARAVRARRVGAR